MNYNQNWQQPSGIQPPAPQMPHGPAGYQPPPTMFGASGYNLTQPPKKKKKSWPWILLALTLPLLLVGGCAAALVLTLPKSIPDADKPLVAAACNGKPVAGVGVHTGGTEGLIAFAQEEPSRDFEHTNNSGALAPPETVSEVTRVLCLEVPVDVYEETCAFGNEGDSDDEIVMLERISSSRNARLVDPSTGETLAETEATNDADVCPGLVFDSTSEERLWADNPGVESYESWVIRELSS